MSSKNIHTDLVSKMTRVLAGAGVNPNDEGVCMRALLDHFSPTDIVTHIDTALSRLGAVRVIEAKGGLELDSILDREAFASAVKDLRDLSLRPIERFVDMFPPVELRKISSFLFKISKPAEPTT